MLLGAICGIGASVIVLIGDLGQHMDWTTAVSYAFLAAPVTPVAATGLAVARAALPALRPGALLASEPLVVSPRRLFRRSLPIVCWLVALTATTALVETVLSLSCVPPQPPRGESNYCYEDVGTRGLPYPFIQRDFLPRAFVYDLLVIGVLHVPVAAVARR